MEDEGETGFSLKERRQGEGERKHAHIHSER